jgi:carboxyl-terminal processing protease
MFKSKNAFLLPFLFLTFMSAGILIGRAINTNSPEAAKSGNFSKMQEIIGILDQEYVDPIKRDELFERTISDMLHKLDPHSNYIRAEDLEAVNEQMQGKFGGVGIRFAVIRDTLCVTNVVPGSPSERSGVKAGDKIIKIDGKSIAGKKVNSEKIMGMLKGEEGTPVVVSLLRGKKTFSTRIVRGIIPIESIVCATMLDREVGYIRLDQFSVTSAEEFHTAAQYLLSQGMKKLIFDLRENGGGVLEGAIRISDEFLKEGMKIVEVRGKNRRMPYTTGDSPGLLEKTPVVLLINENSASASEIVAGALQDNDRATLVGRRSFGKGLVQQDFQLRDGSDLRLTIARYYAPSGRCIQKDFDGDYENYYHDQVNREENGEYFAPDSTLFKGAKKYYTTVKHRTVYGKSGITPDIFVPIDTSNSTYYYVDLRYSPAFQQFAFDYVADKRTKWRDETDFANRFEVTPELMEQFVRYAENNHKVNRNEQELKKSYELIRRALKAEIARQLFLEQGYFTVITKYDNEVQRALKYLKTH